MRQVVLDTETSGLEVSQGLRFIVIGCVEIIDRRLTGRHYHQYIKPQRAIDQGALEVHGITEEFLADKPVFARVATRISRLHTRGGTRYSQRPFDTALWRRVQITRSEQLTGLSTARLQTASAGTK